jgi:signal transduction histidine kinase/DNA-binding LacI/PurR family transcriptional regulator/CheY-like chemotaxis protein
MDPKRKRIVYFSFDPGDAFGSSLVKSIYQRACMLGHDLTVVDGGIIDSPDEFFNKRNLLYPWVAKQPFDAVLLSSIFQFSEKKKAKEFLLPYIGIPVVGVSEKIPGAPSVRVDNIHGFRDLLSHLILDCGCRSFAVISGPELNEDSMERMDALRSTLCTHGIALKPENVYPGSFWGGSGGAGVEVLLDERRAVFDALVCFNDLMAVTAMRELIRRGIRVPEDVRVTGFDDIYESGFTSPALTTVSYSIDRLGEIAVDIADKLMRGLPVPDITMVRSHLVVRESTCPGVPREKRFSVGISPESVGSFIVSEIAREEDGFADEERGEWFSKTMEAAIRGLLPAAELSIEAYIGALANGIYAKPEYSWSYRLWTRAFEALGRFSGPGGPFDHPGTAERVQAALYLARSRLHLRWTKRFYEQETTLDYLVQMSGDFSANFDIGRLPEILAHYSEHIGVRDCFVVEYANPGKDRSRLIARMEGGKALPVDGFGEFPSERLLPGTLAAEYPRVIIEALYVNGKDLGYLLFNLGDHPGILYKSMRYQIANAVGSARLISTVNAYSEGLERMVGDRTAELEKANEALTREMSLREIAEREMLKNRNLESLALLAGGIAHDFNNFLTAIAGNASILSLGADDAASQKELVADMLGAIQNAKALTGQLLTFSKGGTPVKKAVSIVPIVEDTAQFMLRGSSVKADFDFAPELKNTEIDVGQISQVLNNIVINAVHAMPGGGILKISARQERLSDPSPDSPQPPHGLKPGEYLRISIEDSGSGIAPEIIDRIFDPYFTTKEKGSGLGLSTSLAITRKHGGTITVDSVLGKGSAFHVWLPTSDRDAAIVAYPASASIPSGLRFLVMDDNPQVRKILQAFTRNLGGSADIYEDGAAAVAAFEKRMKSGQRYDLMIFDMTVPGGMGGPEAIGRIKRLDPTAVGLLMSGYSEIPEAYPPVGAESRSGQILAKPFTFEEFQMAIHQALSGAR